ncbi:hypothetical protein ACHAW5_008043 [Stephanodiscus triporus]|uniref:Cilia- and flagella-associated protein 157 n=1 Tax=Stephanodiscus triporus TaxID=2934178 RepID=A0ABD3QGX6_9STRA
MTRSQNNVRRKLKLRLPHLPNMNPNSDEISITDSLCSGVLREFANAKALARTTRSKIESKIAGIEDKIATTGGGGDEVQSASATTTTTTTALADGVAAPSHIKSSAAPTADQLAGRGEVVDVFPDIGFSRLDTNVSSMHTDSSWEANESQDDGHEDILRDIVGDDGHNDNDNEDEARLRRQERKERVRERLERYKRDHGQLRSTCMALESALAKTSEKLLKINSRAASKIEALESELRGAREGDETMRINQETCIKELGKKLIRQAHVIKKQRDAVERYKMQLEAMTEELAMQDERDMMREEDVRRLEDLLENSRDRQEQMQTMLQNNIEGMVELKCEVERGSKNIMELEYNLGQKEAMLNRVARDQAEKTERLCELEQVLEDKTFEVESLKKQLDESKESVEAMRQQLEAASKEVEDIKCKFSGWGTSKVDGEAVGDVAAVGRSPHSWRRASIDKIDKSSLLAEDDDIENNMKEAFASELQAKDATIQTLDDACKEKDAMINTVRSDMVKMTSTYKQDSYLKRKEIAKLKQQNAEYALKLRALEKAFQCVNATESMSAVATKDGTKFLAHSAHGGGGERGNK